MNLIRQSSEVFLACGPVVRIGSKEVAVLKSAAAEAPRGRVRINAHANADDPLHEMFIAVTPDSYIRPHKHPGKTEAFHVIYGAVDVVLLDDAGTVNDIVSLAAGPERDGHFYYRVSATAFHTLIIKSDFLIVHEITNGPYRPAATIFAPFAPEESDAAASAAYMAELTKRVAAFEPVVP
jgi:cupin fold WbuC family metalloprotein